MDQPNKTPIVPEISLLDMLRGLLSSADTDGTLAPDDFWHFVAALAQGRGITERLHRDGLEEAEKVAKINPSPAKSFNARQHRAYHIGLLAQLLLDMGRMPGQPSILPGNFNHGAILSDLLRMLDGPGGEGDGTPQMLYSKREGDADKRRSARRVLVGVVLWRAAHRGATLVSVLKDLLPDVSKATWESWLREFDGPDGELAWAAKAAGKGGVVPEGSRWNAPNEELASVIELARRAQGRRGEQA